MGHFLDVAYKVLDESWREKVPSATVRAVEKYHIRKRIIENMGLDINRE